MPEDNTVFDISKPDKVGADPNSIPVIVGHRPTMPDPMFRKPPQVSDRTDNLRPHPEFSAQPPSHSAPDLESPVALHQPGSAAIMEGEPLQSPPFEVDNYSSSPKPEHKRSPYMPISSLTGIAPNVPAASLIDNNAASHEPSPGSGKVVSGNDTPLDVPVSKAKGRFRLWWLAIPLVILVGVYLALDSGVIKSSINLPLHIFKQDNQVTETTTPSAAITTPNLPAGFNKYSLDGTNLNFAAPTAWGVPAVATDPGFSKRGGTNVSDGKYAYIVDFPQNKEVQMVFTSSKYLPAARAAQYFDFLQWCTGTNDGNFYQSALKFNTAAGTDTPATITCDQGPLAGAAKLDNDTIMQLNAKTTDGKDFGDLYAKNLKDKDLVVVRVRDATTKNRDSIKPLLSSISASLQ